jgi:hypothetical protein
VLGSSDTDQATVTGNDPGGAPTGTVSFYECGKTANPTSCTSQAHEIGTAVSLNGATADTATATSGSFTPTSAGYWCVAGYYSGDSNYSTSSDTSVTECVDVSGASSSTTSAPAHSAITLGGTDSDSATVTGNSAGGAPTGTVSFYECGPGATSCTSTANEVGTAVTLTAGAGDTSTAASATFEPTAAGAYCFAAKYSGDSNYSASADTTSEECFTVAKAASSTVTQPKTTAIALGKTDTDSVTVTGVSGGAGGGIAPTGTVTFYECGPTTTAMACTSTAKKVGTAVTVTPQGTTDTSHAVSASVKPTATGYTCFGAVYSGDSNYLTSSDTLSTECFYVAGKPTIKSFSPASGAVGATVTIKGTNLLFASSVTIDGKAATITSDTATQIKIKVATGDKTGKIVVKTPGGSVTSKTNFKVT